ncbi:MULTISPECIES: hypothetical protein [unclassified Anabaena]|uniref:hypothetical protein n=1 Tax=unclassified Anabaena TaxID=2619674 RepID=UPI0039C6F902
MSETLIVTFDGQFLRPDLPLNLEPNKRYVIKIESAIESVPNGNAWDVLEALIGTVEIENEMCQIPIDFMQFAGIASGEEATILQTLEHEIEEQRSLDLQRQIDL